MIGASFSPENGPKIYVDGLEKSLEYPNGMCNACVDTINLATDSLLLGAKYGSNVSGFTDQSLIWAPFKGYIDMLSVYPKELSASEFLSVYNAKNNGAISGSIVDEF